MVNVLTENAHEGMPNRMGKMDEVREQWNKIREA